LAAQRIAPTQVQRLRDLIEVANDLLSDEQDPSAFRDQVDIHAEITKIADNSLLTQLLTSLKRRSEWYSPPFDPVTRRDAWRQHIELVDAIVAGDSARAMVTMGAHIDGSRDRFYAAVTADGQDAAFDDSAVAGLVSR
jgi:DNA-binding FadR family transcriptional regulator